MAAKKSQQKKAPTVPARGSAADLPLKTSTKGAKAGLRVEGQKPVVVSRPANAPPAEWVCNDCRDTRDPRKKLCVCSPPRVREVYEPRFAVPRVPVAGGVRKTPPKNASVRGLGGFASTGTMSLILVGVIAIGIFAYSRK